MSQSHSGSPQPYDGAETRREYLIRTGKGTPRFLQGVYPFVGRGVFELTTLDDSLAYTVPSGKTASAIYLRAGNLSPEAVYLALMADSSPVRYFPLGPNSHAHVELAIVEQYPSNTRIEVGLAGPRGLTGAIVIDVGMLEVDREEV